MHADLDTSKHAGPTYAVLWSRDDGEGSGRLEVFADRFELSSKTGLVVVPFAGVSEVHIARDPADRLRGLPALALCCEDGERLRIASLEGTGALYEIARYVERPALVPQLSRT